MAFNPLSNLGKKLNPLGSLSTPSVPVGQGPVAPTQTGQDYLSSMQQHGKELQSKIDQHVSSQTTSELPTFEINPAKASTEQFMQSVATKPTGGGMMPPTPTAQPLEQTPKAPVQKEPSVMDSIIPSASAQSELSDDEIRQLIKEGYSDEDIVKANEQLKSAPETPAPMEAPKEEPQGLDKLKFQSSESFAPSELGKDVFKFFANVPVDSAQVVGGLWDAVTSPVKTTTGLIKTAKGLSDKAVYGIGNAIVRQLGGKEVPPTEEAEMIDAIGSHIKEQYGTAGKFKKAIVENPTDTLLTLMGGLGAVSKVAEANGFTNVVDKINKVQEVINPVNILKQESKLVTIPAKGALKLGTEALGKTTGTSGETIRKAVELGGTPEFKSALRGETTPQDILASTKEGLQAIKDNRAQLYGADYKVLQANKTPLQINDIANDFADKLKSDYKVGITDKGLDFSQSKITGSTSQSQIQSMFDDIKNWKDTTPEGLDILKQRLQDYYRGTPDSAKGDRLSTIASNAVKDKIVQAVPEYAKMTGTFEKLTNDIRDITKTLSLNDKAQAQTAITKLNSVLRDNFPARQDMIKLIEQYTGKNLQGQIAGASLNAPLAKGLAGVITGGGMITGQLANPAFWAGLAMASPRLIGEMAGIIGTTTNKLKSAITNIKNYANSISTTARSNLEGGIQKVAPGSLVKNPMEGLKKPSSK